MDIWSVNQVFTEVMPLLNNNDKPTRDMDVLAFIQENETLTRKTELNISEMKPGKNDIKAEVKFETDELELLQENTWQMAESFGLDSRIDKLTGKRKVGFYSWDLDCLECVVSDLQKSPKDKEVADRIARKIEESYRFIKGK